VLPTKYDALRYRTCPSRHAAPTKLSLIKPASWLRSVIILCSQDSVLGRRNLLQPFAYFIELDGDVHLPMFVKFETELNELRRKEGAKERARRLLSSYSRDGGVKAIDCKNLNLSSSGGPLPYLGLPVR